jgi:hypothetical protein
MWPQCGARRPKSRIRTVTSRLDGPIDCSVPAPAAGERKAAKIAVFSAIHRGFLHAGRLTVHAGEAYIDPLGRAAASRDGVSAKPLTVHTVTEHPAMISWPCSRRRVGCAGFELFDK